VGFVKTKLRKKLHGAVKKIHAALVREGWKAVVSGGKGKSPHVCDKCIDVANLKRRCVVLDLHARIDELLKTLRPNKLSAPSFLISAASYARS
jgi:hypothetical protein